MFGVHSIEGSAHLSMIPLACRLSARANEGMADS
jgi:hypothetical protein